MFHMCVRPTPHSLVPQCFSVVSLFYDFQNLGVNLSGNILIQFSIFPSSLSMIKFILQFSYQSFSKTPTSVIKYVKCILENI